MVVNGVWYPAGSSQRQAATMVINDNRYILRTGSRDVASGVLAELEVSQRVGNIPRTITFSNKTVFETDDNVTVDQWIEKNGNGNISTGFLHKLESRWRWIVPSAILVVALSAASVVWGLPWSANFLANRTPDSVVESISENSMKVLDKLFFEDTEIPVSRQRELVEKFLAVTQSREIQGKFDKQFGLSFRKLGVPNAFALPSGEIVVTDKFLSVTENQMQIDSVLLHEIGHVVNNHGMQQIIHSSIVAFVVALIAGDASGLEEVFVGLPTFMLQSHYSRAHETEADLFALQTMMSMGIDPIHFAKALEKLDPTLNQGTLDEEAETTRVNTKDHTILDYFSSHPGTAERIQTAREYSKQFHQK